MSGKGIREATVRAHLLRVDALVRAQATEVIRREVARDLVNFRPTEEQAQDFLDGVADRARQRGATPDQVEEALQAAREALDHPILADDAELERVVESAVDESVPQIVRAGANTLGMAAHSGGGLKWLRVSLLGPDLLPLSDDEANAYFDSGFGEEAPVSAAGAREILAAVRMALPDGVLFPEELALALDAAWKVSVIP